ncbi:MULTISPECIES: putative signal transducing protein [Alteromonadaceae]|uniref:putative signal transducing protein n=1 Tax=Alteromonadaceae TaxID=72275 RepID=UPI001C0894D3|nr:MULTISPECIES: DUF2007 domain-containing protein [Aliiglaciecola]MBU2876586.1 DUF2007 domain-containing protein [Aliiglaciecola lipolytica]MDO6711479.1 DUF2007 domain-containing protein [Aliiglaciecola sp. 2_MG-2023]MDO6752544.1 DUF2007 domain-containing protein [Aliiglaciecola sp. 1_MG-2023]
MKKIYWHNDRFRIYQIKQLLDDNHIPNFIKNEFAIGAIGELSPLDAMPEVWLTDDAWQHKANKLIEEFDVQPAEAKNWVCEKCNEENEGSFSLCWNCGNSITATANTL